MRGFQQKHLEEAWKKSKLRCKEREKELRDIVKYVKVGLLSLCKKYHKITGFLFLGGTKLWFCFAYFSVIDPKILHF